MLTAVTGIKWGDEGKGRVIDLLAERADIVVRYQGGNNAGHTVVTKQGKFILNLLPSGILHPNVVCVLADGMVVDLEHLSNEIADIRGKGVSVTPQNSKLSARATISMSQCLIRPCLPGARSRQRSFYPISVIPEIIWIQRYRQENRWFWKRSLALCVILTMAFSPTLPVLQRLRPMGRLEREFLACSLTMWSVC